MAKLAGPRSIVVAFAAAFSVLAAPALAQVRAVDPDTAIDGDLSGRTSDGSVPSALPPVAAQPETPAAGNGTPIDGSAAPAPAVATTPAAPGAETPPADTYHKDDLIGAAEGVFGKGAKGLASMIEDILRKQGEPDAYITGREAGGAIAIGLRYGSGTLHHKIEGNMPVYWTGPSLGFDLGANAANAFVLVYNLYDTADLFHRFGAGEGQAYLVGGFHVSYLRRGDVVLIPVRMGAGLRLGVNVGYMKFSHKQKWMPF